MRPSFIPSMPPEEARRQLKKKLAAEYEALEVLSSGGGSSEDMDQYHTALRNLEKL